jgi:putative DNA primase/helicase
MADVQPIRPEIEVPIEAYEVDEVLPNEQNFTDVGYGRRFVGLHGGSIHWDVQSECWMRWTGNLWIPDIEGWAVEQMKEIARLLMERAHDAPSAQQPILAKAALRLEARGAISAALEMARSEPGVPIHADAYDADPWLLACPTCTVDLRTGEKRGSRREDLCSLACTIDPAPMATPFYDAFIEKVSNFDAEWRRNFHKIMGYCLTGQTSERCLFLFHGPLGSNGKSTVVGLLHRILGGYAARIPTETIVERKGQSGRGGNEASPDLMLLRGRRLCYASESKKGQRWNLALLKDITGGDSITARELHERFTTFRPRCKLILQTNNKPTVESMDEATWKRLYLVPFDYQFKAEEQMPDYEVQRRLEPELPGILARWIAHTPIWRETGLGMTQRSREAVAEYRTESDVIGSYLEDRCCVAEGKSILNGELYKDYQEWAKEQGLGQWSHRSFSMELKGHGFAQVQTAQARYWTGLCLKSRPYAY